MSDRKLLNSELGRIVPEQYKALPESGMVVVLDNIRSAHNVGSALRTADAFKADKVWLCGICACPPSAEIHKSALGAEDSVPWEHVQDTLALARRVHPRARRPLCLHLRKRGRRSPAVGSRRSRLLSRNSPVRGETLPQRLRLRRSRPLAVALTHTVERRIEEQ